MEFLSDGGLELSITVVGTVATTIAFIIDTRREFPGAFRTFNILSAVARAFEGELGSRLSALIGDLAAEAKELETLGQFKEARRLRRLAWRLALWYVLRAPWDRLVSWVSAVWRRE